MYYYYVMNVKIIIIVSKLLKHQVSEYACDAYCCNDAPAAVDMMIASIKNNTTCVVKYLIY